jgi:hypothetical protein
MMGRTGAVALEPLSADDPAEIAGYRLTGHGETTDAKNARTASGRAAVAKASAALA